jgi:hypothetical protein
VPRRRSSCSRRTRSLRDLGRRAMTGDAIRSARSQATVERPRLTTP